MATETPKDLPYAIWELLKPEERPPHGLQWERHQKYWYGFPEYSDPDWSMGNRGGWRIPNEYAHRCIVDAAREVLDDAVIHVGHSLDADQDGWEAISYPQKVVARSIDRTACIYHALKLLREQEGNTP